MIKPLSGTITIGNGQIFPNFNSIFSAIGKVGLKGDLNLAILSDIVEPQTALLNEWVNVDGGPFTLKIYPIGTNRAINCYNSESTLRFECTKNVIIDGSIDASSNMRNLTIKNSQGGTPIALVAVLSNFVRNFTIQNCKVIAGGAVNFYEYNIPCGIRINAPSGSAYASSSRDITIKNNVISNALYGIYAYNSAIFDKICGLRIIGNTIGSTNPDASLGSYGIFLVEVNSKDANGNAHETEISNNEIFNVVNTGTFDGAYGILMRGCDGTIIRGNSIHDIRNETAGKNAYGIYATYNANGIYATASNMRIYNNDIFNIKTVGNVNQSPCLVGIDIEEGSADTIVNNSINLFGSFTGSSTGYRSACIRFVPDKVTSIVLLNNSLSNTMTLPAGSIPYSIYASSRNVFALGSPDYNDYWSGNIGYIDGTDISDLNDWRSKTTADLNSFAENPVYTSNENLEPQRTSPLLFSALSINYVQKDITGFQRLTPTAVGAHEYPVGDLLPVPVIISPINGNYGISFTECKFKWHEVTNAYLYDIQFSKDEDFAQQTISINDIQGTNYSTSLDPLTKYYWRIKARNETMSSFWSKPQMFFTGGNLAAPVLISPERQTIQSQPLTFLWHSVTAANKYKILISVDPNYSYETINQNMSDTTYTASGLELNRRYYWRVEANNGVDISNWSESRVFVITECGGVQTFATAITDCNWSTYQESQALWTRENNGTNPTCNPHTNPGLAMFNSKVAPEGSFALLISPQLDYSRRNNLPAKVNFWLYRDLGDAIVEYDKVEVYASTSPNDANATLLGTFYRDVRNEPVEVNTNNHWGNYSVNIPGSFNGSSNYIIFKGISSAGNNMYVDDINISQFITPDNLPMPELVSPINNAANVSTVPTMSWTLPTWDGDPNNYTYQVQIINAFTSAVIIDTMIYNQAFIKPILKSNMNYEWKVRIVDGENFGPWSCVFNMYTYSYCNAGSLMCQSELTEYISGVQFGNMINENTVCGSINGYSDFSEKLATVTLGQQYTLRVNVTNYLNNDRCGAWIDWNQNGFFDQGSEFYPLTSNDDGATYIENITIPSYALLGYARLRIRVRESSNVLLPCGVTEVGEVEDYSVRIVPVLPVISIGEVASNICTATDLDVSFTVTGIPFINGNVFYAVINTPVPVIIGSINGTATGSYIISANIPMNIPSGEYTIKVIASYQGVDVVSGNSNTFTLGDHPNVYNLNGGGTYCEGGLGVAIALSYSQSGVYYQLYRVVDNQKIAVGDPIEGIGSELGFGLFPEPGIYTVTATSMNQCSIEMRGSVEVRINPAPMKFNVTGGGVICNGSTGVQIGLDGSQIGFIYQLMLGDQPVGNSKTGTGAPFFFNNYYANAGVYTVKATNSSTNCSSVMNGDAEISVYPAPQLFTVSGGGTICEGGAGLPVILDNSEQGVLYRLYCQGSFVQGTEVTGTGNPLNFGLFSVAGAYTVSATNAACEVFMPNFVTIRLAASPLQFVLSSPSNGHYCAGSEIGVTLSLSGSELGTEYNVYYNGNFVNTFLGTGLPMSYTSMKPAGTYTITANYPNSVCTTEMLGSVNVVIDQLQSPDVGVPTGSGIAVNPTNFSWTLSNCAQSYRLIVSTNQDMSLPQVDETFAASSLILPHSHDGLANGTTYYWKVVAQNGEIIAESDIWSFTTETGYPTQTWNLPKGWSIISTNLYPPSASMPAIWNNIVNRLLIIKEGTGNFWMPPQTGSLSSWNVLNGYQIYMTAPATLSITGAKVPENAPIPMNNAGWYMVSYLPTMPMQAQLALSSIANKLVIAKNGNGEMYWPMFGVNNLENSAGTMVEGKGYLIYVVGSSTLIYPTPMARKSDINSFEAEPKNEVLMSAAVRTGSSASMILVADNLSTGTEIGVYNSKNVCVGTGVVRDGRAAITLWGDNPVTESIEGSVEGELLNVQAFDKASQQMTTVTLESVNELTNSSVTKTLNYKQNGLFVARTANGETVETVSITNTPNPFSESTTVEFEITESGNVTIEVYTLEGVKIATLVDGVYDKGIRQVEFRSADVASGSYKLVMRNGSHVATTMMVVVK